MRNIFFTILLLLSLMLSCKDNKYSSKKSTPGIPRIEDGSLFRTFCSFNLTRLGDEKDHNVILKSLNQSIEEEKPFQEIGKVGNLGIINAPSGMCVVLLGNDVVQVYRDGKVTCYQIDHE